MCKYIETIVGQCPYDGMDGWHQWVLYYPWGHHGNLTYNDGDLAGMVGIEIIDKSINHDGYLGPCKRPKS